MKIQNILFKSFPHVLILVFTSPIFWIGFTREWKFILVGLLMIYLLETVYYWLRDLWDNGYI